ANGQVYIVNPAGVVFGEGAVVDVARLVAATGSISNDDFLSGHDRFTRVEGSIENRGTIDAGVAQLIGKHVANHGVIRADDIIVLVAGDDVLLGEIGGSHFVKVSTSVLAAGDAPGVQQSGELDAGDGHVTMAAGDFYSLAIDHTGTTRAARIALEGGDDGVVQVAGTLDASDRVAGGMGGDVTVTGDRIAVGDALIDASGDARGGRVRIGGDFQGQGDLRTASRTVVSTGATIRADAETDGDGGRVIVWADEATGFGGEISARGGAASGDGGFAEVSGRDQLVYRGHADLSAPNGEVGTLLLDPETIVIQGGATNAGGAGTDADLPTIGADDAPVGAGSTTTVTEQGIETQVAHVVLEAGKTIQTQGTFDFGADPDGVVSLGTNLDLTLQTRNNTATDGAGGIDLTGSDHLADLEFRTQGTGTIRIEGGTAGEESGSVTVGKLTTADQQITLNSNTKVTVKNTVSSGAGGVTIGSPDADLQADIASTGTISGTAVSVNVAAPAEIQDGIDIVDVTGGVVLVAAGTYDEQLNIATPNLTLRGQVDPTQLDLIENDGSDNAANVATVAVVRSSAAPAPGVFDLEIDASDVTVENLVFDFNGGADLQGGNRGGQGMVVSDLNGPDATNVTIQNTEIFTGHTQTGIQTGENADVSGLRILSNVIHGDVDGLGEGVFVNHQSATAAGGVTVSGNTIDGNLFSGVSVDGSDVTVTGNDINSDAALGFFGIRVIDAAAGGGSAYENVQIGGPGAGEGNTIQNVATDIRVGSTGVTTTWKNVDVIGNGAARVELDGKLTLDDVVVETAGGSVQVKDDVKLGPGGLSVATGGAAIAIDKKVDGTSVGTGSLTLDAGGAGVATLSGAVGSTVSIASIQVTNAAELNGGSFNTSTTQEYQDAATLGADTTLTSSAVVFGSTVDGTGDGTESLAITGDATFGGAVG
ncbi:MAG: two-partner secretion domain-containing protein, partial [Planctomycetota bacterium]